MPKHDDAVKRLLAAAPQPHERKPKVNTILLKLYIKLQALVSRQDGQDLVEYALLCSLLAFGWVMGVKNVATAVNNAFFGVSSTLGSYIS